MRPSADAVDRWCAPAREILWPHSRVLSAACATVGPPCGRTADTPPPRQSPRAWCTACFAALPQSAAPPRASQVRSPRGPPFDLVGSVPLSAYRVAVTRASVGVCGRRNAAVALASVEVRTLLGQCYRGADASPPIRRAASLASCVGYCRTRPLAALSTVPGVLAPATLVRHVAVASVGRYRYPVGRCRLPPPRMGTQRTCATTMLLWLRRGAPRRVGACSTGRAARAAESTHIVVVGCHSAPRRHHA
jgi:hypothetical protein